MGPAIGGMQRIAAGCKYELWDVPTVAGATPALAGMRAPAGPARAREQCSSSRSCTARYRAGMAAVMHWGELHYWQGLGVEDKFIEPAEAREEPPPPAAGELGDRASIEWPWATGRAQQLLLGAEAARDMRAE